MKKVFLCLVVMVLVGGRSFAMWPFGDTKVSLTAQLANELSAVKAQIAKMSVDVTGIKEATANLSADIKAQGSALVGFNDQISNVQQTVKAGRDAITQNFDQKVLLDYISLMKLCMVVESVIIALLILLLAYILKYLLFDINKEMK